MIEANKQPTEHEYACQSVVKHMIVMLGNLIAIVIILLIIIGFGLWLSWPMAASGSGISHGMLLKAIHNDRS
jgi:hypothetical protein